MKRVGIPLVLTFQLDPVSRERLDAWRQRYFPPERSRLPAHLTLYHQLPGQALGTIRSRLEDYAGKTPSTQVSFSSLLQRQGFIGVRVEGEGLDARKSELDVLFAEQLRAQDRRPYRPHVTVTNLGSPREAARAYAELETSFQKWQGKLLGLELYHYRGGPWEHVGTYAFGAPEL